MRYKGGLYRNDCKVCVHHRKFNNNCFIYRAEATTSSTPDVAFNNTRKYNVSLLRALHKCFWLQFYSVGLLKLVADCAGFAGPLLLNKLVAFIENGNEEMSYGYSYACGLFLTTIIGLQ